MGDNQDQYQQSTSGTGNVKTKNNKVKTPDPKGFKISKNCKRFNRLFHSSFEESDESSMNSTCSSSKSFDVKVNVPGLQVKAGLVVDEFLLEIEIQGEEDEQEDNVEMDQKLLGIKMENNLDFKAIGKLDPDYEFRASILKTEVLADKKVVKTEPISPSLSLSSPENIEEDDLLDDDDEVIIKKPRLKREKKLKNGHTVGNRKSSRLPPVSTFCNKTHEAGIMKRLTVILKKDPSAQTAEDRQTLSSFPTLVRAVKKRFDTRLLALDRLKEFEDFPELLQHKCRQLAEIIRMAQYLVIYTGAGISTSAQIPDYRGPNGIWTLLKNGQGLESQNPVVLTTADPTTTHMTIKELYVRGIAKHVVSQNCDGLHLRSGIPKNALSEVHGNMYVEVCSKCSREYVRLFDVTENTRRYEHRTGRNCYHCGNELRDTVVHFGERGSLRWPLNWAGAEYNANRADVILCIGSSLKVLRRYPWLWCMDQPANKRPKLIIVNLQWTPKDQFAVLKIHGKCDDVMTQVMASLNIPIPTYSRVTDPIFGLATPLHPTELSSKSSRELNFPETGSSPPRLIDINNYIQFEPTFKVPPPAGSSSSSSDSSSSTDSGTEDEVKSTKVRRKTSKKEDGRRKGSKLVIKKGNGWLGNAWGVKPKAKQRKLK